MEIGPILGILSSPRANGNPFTTGQSEAFAEIMSIAERMNCIAYVFSPFDIDWSRSAVWGYRFSDLNNAGEWERQLFPLPTVIYNRIPNRTLENREDIKNLLESLRQKYGPRFFNPCFLDKWKTHKILCTNKKLLNFLPVTRRLQGPEVMEEMLQRYGSVYLKPSANSLGNDILRVSKNKGGQYSFVYQCLNQEHREGIVARCQDIINILPLNGDNREYLVQMAIPLAEFNGNPFDLRILMQKNRHGRWQHTGTAARIAGENSITTHVFYGGTRLPANKVIKKAAALYRFSLKKVNTQLKTLEFVVPRLIEQAHGHSFGELEMDLGIDRRGQVWFFEANSKPFRFDEKLIRGKSLVRLIHYVHYLDSSSRESSGRQAIQRSKLK